MALFFASTSTLTFCHLQAASILKKHLASIEQIKIFGKQRANKKQFVNEKVRLVDEVIENWAAMSSWSHRWHVLSPDYPIRFVTAHHTQTAYHITEPSPTFLLLVSKLCQAYCQYWTTKNPTTGTFFCWGWIYENCLTKLRRPSNQDDENDDETTDLCCTLSGWHLRLPDWFHWISEVSWMLT